MIEAIQLSRCYGTGPQEVVAVKELSLGIAPTERIAVIGKSGSGKSTLLNLLAGLDRPSNGTLSVDSFRLDQMNRKQMAQYRLKTVGVIFQAFQLIPQRTALQNIELPMLLDRQSSKLRKHRAMDLLEQVGLEQRANHFPYQLSGGEQQRVAIARALVNCPKLILADEPTGNLDSVTASQILGLLDGLFRQLKTTVIFVTHDGQIASQISERQFCMSDGELNEISCSSLKKVGPTS